MIKAITTRSSMMVKAAKPRDPKYETRNPKQTGKSEYRKSVRKSFFELRSFEIISRFDIGIFYIAAVRWLTFVAVTLE